MTDNDKQINKLIMQEIGLDIGPGHRIYDQDTGMAIRINGMDVVAPGIYGGRQAIEFDPYNNRKMMSQLFSMYLDKYSEESGVDVLTYYNVDGKDSGRVECRLSNNDVISSKNYVKDSLKYADIIMQLNNDGEVEDLYKYDTAPEHKTVKGKGTQKNGTTAAKRNSTNRKTTKGG